MLNEMRPTSYAVQRWKKVLDSRSAEAAVYNALHRIAETRGWIRASNMLDDLSTDNYPVYNDITDVPLPGTPGGIAGFMKNG